MPFYEYVCETCDHEFEVLKKSKDPDPEGCEECEGPIRKKIFAPATILKGAGFYETEYGRSKHNHPNHKGSKDASSSASSAPATSTATTSTSSGSGDSSSTSSSSDSKSTKAKDAGPKKKPAA